MAGAALAGGDGSGVALVQQRPLRWHWAVLGALHPRSPWWGTAPPALLVVLNSAQWSHLGFIASIYYRKTSVCFWEQLSGQILADKQCWPVF